MWISGMIWTITASTCSAGGAAPCRREGPAAAAGRAVDVLVLDGTHDAGLAPVDLLRRRDMAVAVLLDARHLVCPEDVRQARVRGIRRWPHRPQQDPTCLKSAGPTMFPALCLLMVLIALVQL